jgi:hypothetical protein
VLNAYLAATQNLLQNPSAPTSLYSAPNLTTFINTARGQLAGDGQCVRALTTFNTVINQDVLAFSTATGLNAAVAGILHLRMITITNRSLPLNAWPWEYFQQYFYTSGALGQPTDWAQYGQGVTGSFFLNPIPNAIFNLVADAVCYPIPLVDDTTVEAIPYPWTDAVPYFAAYLALMGSQTNTRTEYASRMLQLYNEFKDRARRYSTPDVLPLQYEQTPSRLLINQTQPQNQQRAAP